MPKPSKFTDEQKYEIAMELIAGKLSPRGGLPEVGISSTYAYKLKDRAFEILRGGIGRPAGKPPAEVETLRKRIADLEQLAGDQALVIRAFKKRAGPGRGDGDASGNETPIRRLAHAAEEPVSSVGRWVKPSPAASPSPRPCPVSGTHPCVGKSRRCATRNGTSATATGVSGRCCAVDMGSW
ncbi:MAG: hypothetical protein M5R36_11255 [Deltaproteobacteria bacterium]|nr:hypothetical protein [Deltaproteobacteria bacterium]